MVQREQLKDMVVKHGVQDYHPHSELDSELNSFIT